MDYENDRQIKKPLHNNNIMLYFEKQFGSTFAKALETILGQSEIYHLFSRFLGRILCIIKIKSQTLI